MVDGALIYTLNLMIPDFRYKTKKSVFLQQVNKWIQKSKKPRMKSHINDCRF